MAAIEMTDSLQRVGEQPLELSVEERNCCRWRVRVPLGVVVQRGASSPALSRRRNSRVWSSRLRVAKVEDEIQRIRDGIPAFMDENFIPKRLNFVKDVVDSEDLHLNVYRETLQQNKILRVINMDLAKKCFEMLAEIAEKKDDDYKKFYEQFGKRLSLGIHKAELLRFNTSKFGVEQISFEEYVDRRAERHLLQHGREYHCCVLFVVPRKFPQEGL